MCSTSDICSCTCWRPSPTGSLMVLLHDIVMQAWVSWAYHVIIQLRWGVITVDAQGLHHGVTVIMYGTCFFVDCIWYVKPNLFLMSIFPAERVLSFLLGMPFLFLMNKEFWHETFHFRNPFFNVRQDFFNFFIFIKK